MGAPILSQQFDLFSEPKVSSRFSNSATYLASLYIQQDYALYQWCVPQLDAHNLMSAERLRSYFTSIRFSIDETESGVDGRVLIIDDWAEGDIYWDELTDLWGGTRAAIVPQHSRNCILSKVLRALVSLHEMSESIQLSPVIDNLITQVMSEARIEDNVVLLTTKLSRKDYARVNQALVALGGAWDRKRRGHIFTEDPSEKIDRLITTGTYTRPAKVNTFGYFPTPRKLAEQVVRRANLRGGMKILEPSAGTGGIVDIIALTIPKTDITVVELQGKHAVTLKEKGYQVIEADFMLFRSDLQFDAVIMNPPFERQQDIDHVLHAWSMVKPGGRLVSIMSAGVKYRSNTKSSKFRALLGNVGEFFDNEEQAFKESGTNVSTVTVVMNKVAA